MCHQFEPSSVYGVLPRLTWSRGRWTTSHLAPDEARATRKNEHVILDERKPMISDFRIL